MRILHLVALLVVCWMGVAFGQTAAPLSPSNRRFRDKNFYLFSLMERTRDVNKASQKV